MYNKKIIGGIKMDITIDVNDYKLNVRAACVIKHNNKILVHKNINSNYYCLIGGRVKIGEDSETTIKREVEEETGVTGLAITEKLQRTYHIFKRNGRYKLKITQWFEMRTKYEGTPQGQTDEGIERVEWVNPKDIKFLLENSYENIKLLFEEEKMV